MNRVALSLVLSLAVGAGLLVPGVAAQESDADQILAKAQIIGALSVTGVRDLDFGTLLGGATIVVDVTEPNSGKFEVDAQPGAEVQIEFTQLPSELTRVGGAETIALTLEAASNDVDNPATGDPVDPAAGPWAGVFPASGQGFVWIGGSISPAADQAVGSYQATIELTAAYTGN